MSVIRTRPRVRLPDQISVEFGPADLLGPAFLLLDRTMRERGVYLSISHDLEDLAAVNRANRQDWYPLLPMFDPAAGGITPETGFWVCGVNEQGEVVMAHACRLYSWPNGSLFDAFDSMKFFYPRPEEQKNPGELCLIDNPALRAVSGRVCYSGAMWVRSDYRGLSLATISPRVTRAYALTRWAPDFLMGMVKTSDLKKGAGAKQTYGWPNVEGGVRWRGSSEGSAEMEITVGWFTNEEATDDLEQYAMLLRHQAGVLVVGNTRQDSASLSLPRQ